MTILKATDLRSYARRDWQTLERLSRRERATLAVAKKVSLAIQLYEAAKSTRPDWPSAAERDADIASHRRFRELLNRAPHVGRR
ncbi:MAG: hypothetical protein H6718_10045 [Polyangiaceae bacterium]|nr:hypothetical protein [Myxococcales bacterium]MCB9585731.1 hypothetical protein [Polyangiaceae bacterium]MCB9607340.1 hypothetical protein [Polyangiaceae bacterium]